MTRFSTRAPTPLAAIISELRQPSTPSSQVTALRCLKNEVIGHEQKKELCISLGVVECLEAILSRRNGNTAQVSAEGKGRDGEEAQLQTVTIVGSLAYGGPAFLTPLRAGQIYASLLTLLNPTRHSPTLVLAALRSLNAIADAISLLAPQQHNEEAAFTRELYAEQHISSLQNILDQEQPQAVIQQQISLAASLIAKTCRTEARRKQLQYRGMLERTLATKLASFIVTTGLIPPSPYLPNINTNGAYPVGKAARLAPILQAICTIIHDSSIRASKFCCSSMFARIFPFERDPYSWRAPPVAQSNRRDAQSTSSLHQVLDPPPPFRNGHANYPPFNNLATWGKVQKQVASSAELSPGENLAPNDEDQTPLVHWLIEIVRAKSGITRLMAIWLIVIFYRSHVIPQRLERGLSMLILPALAQCFEKDLKVNDAEEFQHDTGPLSNTTRTIIQRAPRILALFIAESTELQKSAADAHVIKKLSLLLKQSYDPIPAAQIRSVWKPNEATSQNDSLEDSQYSRIGPTGYHLLVLHTLQMRESALIALAAMASSEDDYRKAIIDNGVVPFVLESLKPADKPLASQITANDDSDIKLENPTSVLIAACTAGRALSRSVSALRTSLIDAGLADPIFQLLKHSDLEVKIAASAAVINLLLEFSPMRDLIIDYGVLNVLCEHAHSYYIRLRLNAVWALKHLVLGAPNTLKKECVQELGAGWLKQIICNGTEDGIVDSHRPSVRERGGTPIAMGTPNAAGEQVDLLNAMEDQSQGSLFNQDDEDDEVNMVDSFGDSRQRHRDGRATTAASNDFSQLEYDNSLTMRDHDDQTLQTTKDELAVQEQGLTLVRNLICGTGASDMVDYLFQELGQDQIFDMLTNLLEPRSAENSAVVDGRRLQTGASGKYVPPPTQIVTGVCYILAHLASSHPRHRQLLIAKPELLRRMIPLFNHPNSDVRVCCVWTVINLTWTDDQSDKVHSRNRANELRKLGVMAKLEELQHDPELDVRERTKMAVHQMNEQLR